ncbi:CYTH and CHAD domain-containing protein [Tenggerimyces flavus]|uniref:CHAD domain-containing protein n=1 Tax=Tenggerimyces flavus TaxID=1708749 RepID=A0ABV7YJ39_9ACTN|nr:CYTH and CHAD domain-containing protein [Tenggerimyces flavus]MBM7783872.1 inorganic triphosphatase YgiF [Tenggerimyces flavus]
MAQSRNGSPEIVREKEYKFRVHGQYHLPDLSLLVTVADGGTVVLDATYYDTADLRLAREGASLRMRTGGSDEGWHLKLKVADESGAGVRDEIRLPLSGKRGAAPPDQLLSLVAVLTAGLPVEPRARLRTERAIRILSNGAGIELAELTDDRVNVLEEGAVAAQFRELELELRPDADEKTLDQVCRLLVDEGAVAGGFTSKAARALGGRASSPPEVPAPEPVSEKSPARSLLQYQLATYVRALRSEDIRVRLDLPDSVHQFRVSIRRLRSVLRVFRPLLDTSWSEPLREELQFVASLFGPVRDTEVQLARLESHAASALPAESAEDVQRFLRRRLGAELSEAREQALSLLGGSRYLKLHEALVEAVRAPRTKDDAERSSRKVLPPLVEDAWKKLSSAVSKLSLEDPDEVWHAARIKAKRARYAADACAPALGKPAKQLGSQLSSVTDVLGEHQDSVVAASTLSRLALSGRVPSATAYWLGVLHERELGLTAAARASFAAVWQEASKRKYREWVHGGS